MESSRSVKLRRRQILCFLGILVSLMVLLCLISYSAEDQASGDLRLIDLWKVFVQDQAMQARAAHTQNLLGLIGAFVANVLIHGTIGYAILILPILGLTWSLALLRQKEVRKLIVLTNYLVVLGLLFAAFTGAVRIASDYTVLSAEWTGAVGEFLADISSKLIGLTGTFLVLAGAMVVVLILAIDLDLERSYLRLRAGVKRLNAWTDIRLAQFRQWIARRRKEAAAARSRKQIEIRRPERSELGPHERREGIRGITVSTNPDDAPEPRRPSHPTPPIMGEDAGEELQPEPGEESGDLQLDIREAVTEAEVDFDDREQGEDVGDEEIDYVQPSVDLLDSTVAGEQVDEGELKANADLLRSKLADFGVSIESVSVTPGPVVTLYELVPSTGVKVSRIESLEDDIALALKARGIRIIAPMPGKGTVGVEIPNHHPSLVRIRSVINSAKFRDSKYPLPLAMGKTISGEVYVDDLSRMPHLLIAGATGSGKSVGINTIIASLVYRLHPSDIKFVIIDPKKIELAQYARLNKHYLAVSPDLNETILTTPQNAVMALKSVELEMERRYDRLAAAGVRNIADYNERFKAGKLHDTEIVKHRKMPYLIVVIDELADLMITAAREVEEPIARLAQLARAVGIHLVLATQRPSVDVITGVIKANFPARIAYQVATKIDSRTILDMNGAEQLLGNGDMLYESPGSPKPIRIQNAFISTDEVERITQHIARQQGYSQPMHLPSAFEKKRGGGGAGADTKDELFEEAAHIVVRHQQGSVSLLQRRLKVGYSRAARLIDELEAAGIVGPFDGSKAREVLVENEAELDVMLRNMM